VGLVFDPDRVTELARVERTGVASPPFGLRTGSPPFGLEGPALKVWVPGRRVPSWKLVDGSAGPPPPASEIPSWDFDHPFPLVPYGNARIRIAEFPLAEPSSLGSRDAGEPPA
jgi:hypothetical protein